MYSREEASKIKQQFWINFGKYMKPIPNAEGYPINWVNYRTGIKNIQVRLELDAKVASIAIAVTHPDAADRNRFSERLLEFKKLLNEMTGEEWIWEADCSNEFGQYYNRFSLSLSPVSVFNQADWPAIISFFKPRLIAVDEFWTMVKPFFEVMNS